MKEKLFILWTNDDPITSENMVCMYSRNAVLKHWWDEVTVILWGATVKFAAADATIQSRLKQMLEDGVKVSACKTCADDLGVAERLDDLGIELRYWGEPLTELLKGKDKVITI